MCTILSIFFSTRTVMANIFTLENVHDFSEKINIDELYEKKKQYDLSKLDLYNKILNRIHIRIKTTARQRMDEQFCWFVVPEVMIGVPKYDQGACIAYLLDKLKENGFNVRYVHPNALFITWHHWVPSYVRDELKKKTGIILDEHGKIVSKGNNGGKLIENDMDNTKNLEEMMFKTKASQNAKPGPTKQFTPIQSYKPQGSLVYDDDLIRDLETKFI